MTNSRALLCGPLGTAALLALVALAGCGSDPDNGSGTESPTTAATTEPAEALTAADGSDYTACDDGRCEVLITEPVELVFDTADGALTLNIGEVSQKGISIKVANESGSASGTALTGVCEAVITGINLSSRCNTGDLTTAEPQPEPGVLVLQTLDMTEDTAVLRITLG